MRHEDKVKEFSELVNNRQRRYGGYYVEEVSMAITNDVMYIGISSDTGQHQRHGVGSGRIRDKKFHTTTAMVADWNQLYR